MMHLGPKLRARLEQLNRSQPPKPAAAQPAGGFDDTSVAITCMYRFDMLERLLRSVRKFYPTIAVVVADNSFPLDEWGGRDFCRLRELCCRYRAECVILPHNVGCAATRNHAVLSCRTPYVIVCEEDFEFTREADL